MDTESSFTTPENINKIEARRLADLVLKGFDVAEMIEATDCIAQSRNILMTIERPMLDRIRSERLDPLLAQIIQDPDVCLSLAYKCQSLGARPSLSIEFMRSDDDAFTSIGEFVRLGGDIDDEQPFQGFGRQVPATSISHLLEELIRPENGFIVSSEGIMDVSQEMPTLVGDPQSPIRARAIEDILKEKGCPYVQVEEFSFDDVDGCRYIIRIESECVDGQDKIMSITILADNRRIEIHDGLPVEYGQLDGAIIESSSLEQSIRFIEEDSFGRQKLRTGDPMAFVELTRQLNAISCYLYQNGLNSPDAG